MSNTTTFDAIQNEDRAERAERHVIFVYQGSGISDTNDEAVCDALTDLMHWCKANEVDFEARLRMAQIHFEEEQIEAKETETK